MAISSTQSGWGWVHGALGLHPWMTFKGCILENDRDQVIETLTRERDEARRHLGNTLARIHGDGGHYQEKHGTDRAVVDADRIVVNRNAELDEARAALDAARREGAEAMREAAAVKCLETHTSDPDAAVECAAAIRALPLSVGEDS